MDSQATSISISRTLQYLTSKLKYVSGGLFRVQDEKIYREPCGSQNDFGFALADYHSMDAGEYLPSTQTLLREPTSFHVNHRKFSNLILTAPVRTQNGDYGFIALLKPGKETELPLQDHGSIIELSAQFIGELIDTEQKLDNYSRRRDFYKQLYYNSPVMICTLGDENYVTEINEEGLSLLQVNREDIIGRLLPDFILEEDRAPFIKSLPIHNLRHPVRLKTADGNILFTELSTMSSGHDSQSSTICVIEDVTARHHAQIEVERQKLALEQSNEGLSRFAYVASHDLREPLRKIRQFAEMLVDEYSDILEGDGSYYLDILSSSALRISRLVSDLLAYSRSSNANLVMKDINLNEIVSQVLEELQSAIETSDANIEYKNLPTVKGDETAVFQLFLNLIGNALKYVSRETSPNVQIKAITDGRYHQIIVKDNGIGLSGEGKERVFEPFFRLQNKSDYRGSGIGLATCKTVCDRHGWKVKFNSNENGGTNFVITIPTEQ